MIAAAPSPRADPGAPLAAVAPAAVALLSRATSSAEATLSLLGRSGRAAATALSVVIGVAAFVTASGLTATAGASVNARFERFAAAEVTLADSTPNASTPAFGRGALAAVTRLPGVRGAG